MIVDDVFSVHEERVGRHRIVHLGVPYSHVAHSSVWFGAGSADEPAPLGLTHLLEHVISTHPSRGSGISLVDQVARLGGDANASTTRDGLVVWARAAESDMESLVEATAAVIQTSAFDDEVVHREADLVVRELESITPGKATADQSLLEALVTPPYSWLPGGTIAGIRSLTTPQLEAWFDRIKAQGISILLASSERPSVDVLRPLLVALESRAQKPLLQGLATPTQSSTELPTGYVAIGGVLDGAHVEVRAAGQLLTTLLGNSPLSRRASVLRESDRVAFDLSARSNAVGPQTIVRMSGRAPRARTSELVHATKRSIEGLATREIEAHEFSQVKRLTIGRQRILWDSPRRLIDSFGTNRFLLDEQGWTPSSWLRAIQEVQPEQLSASATELLDSLTTLA